MFISSILVLLSLIFVEIAQVRASPQPSITYRHRRAHSNSTLNQSNGTSSGANLTSSHMVFAHFMVSNTGSYEPKDWTDDVTKAQVAKIDGFALNISPRDDFTGKSLDDAYNAVKGTGFKLFLSFDYETEGEWDMEHAKNYITQYKDEDAQYKVHGKPMVSTHGGKEKMQDWKDCNCFFIPDDSNADPATVDLSQVDGIFSWDAWPDGANNMTADKDETWQKLLKPQGKPYMMALSPWFYANMDDKNWLRRGEGLYSTRWNEVKDLQPDFVQILTWNNYGESHYIGPVQKGVPDKAGHYVNNDTPHDHWRDLLPFFIAQYKGEPPPQQQDMIVYCHKPNPKDSGDDGNTSGTPPGQPPIPAQDISADSISVDALFSGKGVLVVKIAGKVITTQKCDAGLCSMSVEYDKDANGDVSVHIQREGKEVVVAGGTSIGPPADGKVNFNAVVGGVSSTGPGGNVTAAASGTFAANSTLDAVVGSVVDGAGNVTAVVNATASGDSAATAVINDSPASSGS